MLIDSQVVQFGSKQPTSNFLQLTRNDIKWQSLPYNLEPTMSLNVSLPPELENRVRQHVESGLYSSASEVIREALRLFEAYQGVQAANLAALKADIAQGVADISAGRVREVSMASIKERGRAILASEKLA
jgi:antitoxin ParD1/3/4